ncbi:carbohydrate-binding protein [Kitasatospora cheerisanensis]|uniref:Chitinase n=1 Tax=Kitasatospora cheerisanensis KCTC 2395 TaxID=1348663 RepID=A0A066Z286_9ACTN|nr:carbohydrate-binding protein [Kitasatospora cheerisanensis]KDN87893.1 chitinase [Kitasatospora cheerisanensis KCTC 2395]
MERALPPHPPAVDTPARRRRPRRALAVALSVFGLLAGGVAAVSASGPANAATAQGLGSNWYASAPYLMPEDNSPPDAAAVMDATGQKAFQLAFILAQGSSCSPAWGGTSSIDSDTTMPAVIQTIRNKGGDVSVSVGGYGGTKLGQTCGTPEATAAAYQKVVTKYGLKAIDFDLEEPEYENTAAIHNEIGAARILQQNNPGLYVSITTAGTNAGTGWFGTQMLLEAKSQGFTPNNYSIMPFDGGFSGAAAQTDALVKFNQILQSTFGWNEATAYAHEGVSMMNGRTDAAEYFRQADFQTVLDFATAHKLARYTYWSVNRDRQCPGTVDPGLSGSCSSVAQNDWDFTKFTVRFAGATPPTGSPSPTVSTSPSGSSSPSTGTTPCSPAWQAGTTYVGGDKASYNGHNYHAKWWTLNENPSASGQWGVWADDGPCS